jgi:pyruvate/2-oxoglutarate dehydrogenase complex dihydrolipoamide dehydrogenase (E3) component
VQVNFRTMRGEARSASPLSFQDLLFRMQQYDLAIIGGGTAGLVAAAGGALLGARVALFEHDRMGGDCLWTGCVPTKALIRSATVYHEAKNGERYGLPELREVADTAAVLARMRSVRATIEPNDSPARFRDLGVDVILERAELREGLRIASATRDVHARRVLIATGSRATAPPIPGLDATGYLTHATALDQERFPRSITILGAGAVGLEFAQVYARLGVAVTVLERAPHILPLEDAELTEVLRQRLRAEGVEIFTSCTVDSVKNTSPGKRVYASGRVFDAEEILVAAGRRSNVEGIGLEAAGVQVNDAGVVVDRRLRTTAAGVFAAGDVTGLLRFTHVADYQARTVVANALVPFVRRSVDYRHVPWVTYTDPELARVGLTEQQATAAHSKIEIYRWGFEHVDRAILEGRAHGVVKLVADAKGRLLGAHILAPDAGNLLASLTLALKEGVPLTKLANVIHPYPTLTEAIRKASEGVYRRQLDGLGGRLLRRLVKWRSVA